MANPRILYPVTIDATNNTFYAAYPSGGAATPCTIAAGTYYVSGDDSVVAGQLDLIKAVRDALDVGLPAGASWDVIMYYSATPGSTSQAGTVNISNANDTFDLRFDHALSTLHPLLGFASTSHPSGASQTINSDYQHQYGWYPERPLKADTGSNRTRVIAVGEAFSGRVAMAELQSKITRQELIELLPRGKIVYGESGYTNEDLYTFWASVSALTDFRFYPDAATVGTYTRMCIRDDGWLSQFMDKSVAGGPGGGAARLMYPNFERYAVGLPMQEYVA